MLHELLLSLADGSSPLLSFPEKKANESDHEKNFLLQSLLSPAEQSLLRSLAQDLGQKNKDIKSIALTVSASHTSTVCRAVSTAILSTHLANFQRRILEVEKDVLEESSSIVGAYNIVPLSAIVGAFDGWPRKLDWLWRLVRFIQMPKDTKEIGFKKPDHDPCTAAEVVRWLRDSMRTGYPDIEAISRDLVKVAETAWLRQVSAWVLYGRYPTNGDTDFFITRQQVDQSSSVDMYNIKDSLIPIFVSKSTAQSILFIGKSINHIRDRQSTFATSSSKVLSPELILLANHLAQLSSLDYPLSPSSFSAAIGAIRLSLSQNALQKLLPVSKVVEILQVLKGFFLLARGEFAVALVTAAEDRLSSRNKIQRSKQNRTNDLVSMAIKEGEVTAVLARTWTSLASLQSLNDEYVDEELDLARELISLSIKSIDTSNTTIREPNTWTIAASFDDLLLPSSTILSLHVPSPLDLFLTLPDVDAYSHIHAYLLAIRRAHLRLSRLFSLSVLRREHPSSKISGSENQRDGFDAVARLRARSCQRTKDLRPVWASIGSAVFFLSEIAEYFQGEVIQSSWSNFYSWLIPSLTHETRPGDSSLSSSIGPAVYSQSSRPASSRSGLGYATQSPHDPETLTQAHKRYLEYLQTALLLDDREFTGQLRRFMTSTDHLIALMQRLDTVQHNSNLEIDDRLAASANPSSAEEQKIMEDLTASRVKISSGVQGLIGALRVIDAARAARRRYKVPNETSEQDGFVPWTGAGVDRLLLKFDYDNADELILQRWDKA